MTHAHPSAWEASEVEKVVPNKHVPDLAFRRFRTLEGVVSTSGVGRAVLLLELVIRLLAPSFNLILSLGCDFLGDGVGSSSSSSSS